MTFKVGDRVKFKDDGDQWTCMFDITIQKVNNDGTYDIHGRNPHLKRRYGTEHCCTVRVKEYNLERDSDGGD
jgi:hypothetical protein